MTGSPVNCSETMSRAYIEPQPPETSCTSSLVGFRASLRVAKILASLSSRYSGASTGEVVE